MKEIHEMSTNIQKVEGRRSRGILIEPHLRFRTAPTSQHADAVSSVLKYPMPYLIYVARQVSCILIFDRHSLRPSSQETF